MSNSAARKKRRFSITRAIRSFVEHRKIVGFEAEVMEELRAFYPDMKDRGENVISMPAGHEPAVREMQGLPEIETRADVTTTTAAGSIFTFPGDGLIDLLRAKTVLARLGATFLVTNGQKFNLPRTTGTVTAAWVTEGTPLASQGETSDGVAFVPKSLGGAVLISRKFAFQSSLQADRYVENDLARTLAVAIDAAGINGNGSGATPIGILNNAEIQAVNTAAGLSLGPNGGALAYSNLCTLEDTLAEANADDGDYLGFLTSGRVRAKLRQTAQVATYPRWCWESGVKEYGRGFGRVLDYPALNSTLLPSALSKGSGSNLSAIICGNWPSLVLATSGPPGVLVNPYTNALSGGIQVTAFIEADINVMHPSFCFYSDVNYS